MVSLRDVGLRPAIAFALLVGLLVPAAATSWYTLRREREGLTRELEAYHARVTAILALGMQQPVWTMEPDLGEPLLDSVMEDRRIVRVTVDGDRGPFLERAADDRRTGAPTVRRVVPIRNQGEAIGEVTVEVDTGSTAAAAAASTRRILSTALAQLVLSLAVILLVLRVKVLWPVERLVRQSERLARRELEEPFRWGSGDELGRLGQSLESTREALLALFGALDQRTAEQARLNQELEAALAARRRFLANMSHELKTPLNSVIGFSTILIRRLGGTVDAKEERLLQNILRAGQRLLGLVNDVLDLATLDAGDMELELEVVDLRQLLEGMCAVVEGVAARKRVRLELEVDPQVSCLTGDAAKLKHCVHHLLTNAVEFSPEGETVTVRAVPAAAPAGVRVEVTDRGPGIAAADLGLVFEEFRQVDEGPARCHQGAGLGLALVKRLVELHGGSIGVSSEPGRGSTFAAFLPLSPVVEVPPAG